MYRDSPDNNRPLREPAHEYFPGMGTAVADRTINRKIVEGGTTRIEKWADVAYRVSMGNASLVLNSPTTADVKISREFDRMHKHMRSATLLMSGRHLQHGDATQPDRNLEIFSNCATAANTFLLFYLLLNGSGVGRAYDDDLIKSDLNFMPIVVPVIGRNHPDVVSGRITGFLEKEAALHLYGSRETEVFEVPDSREGWAKVLERLEVLAYEKKRDVVFIPEFTGVRGYGSPIMGMQGRPASGPGPLMNAIAAIAKLRDAGMAPWRAAMFADHYAAECVLVGGARRAARMGTKSWRDKTIHDFIDLKRGGFLWSSNNSVMIDEEFRTAVVKVRNIIKTKFKGREQTPGAVKRLLKQGLFDKTELHAYEVLVHLADASYHDGTGEPGVISQDRLTQNDEGIEVYADGILAESDRYKLDAGTIALMKDVAKTALAMRYNMITNPCGEINLLLLGAFCIIADVVPFHAANDDEAEDAFRTAARALIRVNTMNSIYGREVKRTNRIGVGLTGFHEWAYSRFGYTWYDIVDETRSLPMWQMLSRFKRAVVDEAARYSAELGLPVPHTNVCVKPSGTVSKLFGLTEGVHLPPMREFIRWVQFRNDDPLVAHYAAMGYPVKHLVTYEGTTIVGFPTRPAICDLDGGKWVVTAGEATPTEQYQFLRLLEKWWIRGIDEDGITPLFESGSQVSYTLKYDPKKVDFYHFIDTLIEGQFTVRCCSVMPQADASAYEYTPESACTKDEYEMIRAAIKNDEAVEDIGFEHVDCEGGACPVDFGAKVTVEMETAA